MEVDVYLVSAFLSGSLFPDSVAGEYRNLCLSLFDTFLAEFN